MSKDNLEKYQDLIQIALAAEADHAAIALTADIKFVEEFRKACEQNVCRKYDTNWVCPPAVGDFCELKADACKYRQGLLFQTVHQLKTPFDWKGMMAGKKVHDAVFRKILEGFKSAQKEGRVLAILPLNAGACEYCSRCAYLDKEPCRFPAEAFSSVEAYGIDVINLEKTCNMPYCNAEKTVAYVGLLLFNEP